ncbi:MAG: CDP-alcohol phosphatidyltransferase family protein [Agathobacter sp.]|nr:CDP-alcohol phosphatidyltransferase family protein [Agathobacter sp.]
MSNNVDKIVPSKLEKAMYAFLYKYVGDKLPPKVTPNQITLVGAICGLIGIICGFLAGVSKFFLIGTVLGIMGHLVCDDLDGYIARKRNMSSLAGGYFDLLTDILHITYLIIALSYAGVVQFKIAIWMVPVYALIIFTSMNSILYLKKFPFPRLGPIETHLFFQAICILSMIFGTGPIITIKGFAFNIADIIFIVGGIPMYFEMIRLQIELFKDLQKEDKK